MKRTGNLVFLDIETYYDGKIGLGFKSQTTEEYIRDPRFEMIGFSYKINNEPTVWVSGDNRMMHATLRSLNLEQQIVVAHNAPWDLGALFFHYGIHAGVRICTMMMAAVAGLRPVVGGSLAKLGDALQIGTKGHEVVEAEGKRRQDFMPEGLARYGVYCCNDVDMMARLFYLLAPLVGQKHMRLINATVRMFTEPVFQLDKTTLETRYTKVQQMKRDTLERLGADMNVSPEQVGDMLRSNPKFAELLLANGITPGMKVTQGEQKKADKEGRDPVPTFAFAKTDEFMGDLLEHPRSEIVSLAEARMGEKSAGEEGRLRRFLGIADRGPLPIPLTVGGAHTLRYAAWDSINVQNLPKRKGMDKSLSLSIKPPPGYAVVTGDSSQIECRVLAYVAQQLDLLTEFRLKRDPYAALAAIVYHRPVEDILAEHLADINPGAAQRFMGKTTVLACGYQLGVDTFATRNRIPVKVARPLVDGYRMKNDKIVGLWSHLQYVVLPAMAGRGSGSFGGPNRDLIKYGAATMLGTQKLSPYIELPTGERVWYHGLESRPGKYGLEYTYWKGREVAFVYGGSLTENIIQALAFSIMVEQALMIDKKYKLRMNCHDAWSVAEPIEVIPDAMAYMRECMSWVPPYMGDCPLACDIKQGPSYGHT